jgi:hypothetical protein
MTVFTLYLTKKNLSLICAISKLSVRRQGHNDETTKISPLLQKSGAFHFSGGNITRKNQYDILFVVNGELLLYDRIKFVCYVAETYDVTRWFHKDRLKPKDKGLCFVWWVHNYTAHRSELALMSINRSMGNVDRNSRGSLRSAVTVTRTSRTEQVQKKKSRVQAVS